VEVPNVSRAIYRYVFAEAIPAEEAEATLVLALLAAESLHGEAQVRLDGAHHFDPDRRACVLDAGTPAGRDLNRLFVGFLRREFGEESFTVERVADTAARANAATTVGC
jgi:hypothetical protein